MLRHGINNVVMCRPARAQVLLLCGCRDTFYTQDQVVGYTDYPSLDEVENSKKA